MGNYYMRCHYDVGDKISANWGSKSFIWRQRRSGFLKPLDGAGVPSCYSRSRIICISSS